jgi:hypothetical protein
MLVLILVLATFVGPVSWALVDLWRRPKSAFVAAGRNRNVWIGLLVVALVGPFVIGTPPLVSSGIGIWYLIAVRPKVAAVMPSRIPPADER